MHLIDSHIHLDFSQFDTDRSTLIDRAKALGIQRFVVPATTQQSWAKIEQLSGQYQGIFPAYGIHPYFIDQHSLADCEKLETWIKTHPCTAIGETGLDFYLSDLDRDKQSQLFEAQLDIAKNHNLPVILHARKAVDAVIQSLRKYQIRRGIVHSFNGSYVQAMRLIDQGLKLGFGGAITYPRATRLRKLISQIPLSAICIETDAPDQPVHSLSKQRNEPAGLTEVLETLVEILDQPSEIIASATVENSLDALNIC